MASNYYLGRDPETILGDSNQFFYALRRNDDGELYCVRSDQLKDTTDVLEINRPGDPAETFEDFEAGVDYFEGVDDDHEIQFENLVYPQYRWDDRSMFYYVDDEGQLVVRINKGYTYPTGVSS
jgi:hypothetical protein